MISSDLATAIGLLEQGQVVGLPTETVYGLAARIDRLSGIEKIFKTKQRPFFDPLIVHVASLKQAQELTLEWNECVQKLAETFWPGPLTLLLKKNPKKIDEMITSGLERVGLRWPKHLIAENLIMQSGPLAAPSANKFGKTSPTTALHVEHEFKNEDIFILDGGACEVGIESTVLLTKLVKDQNQNSVTELSILRPGHIKRSDIEKTLAGFSFKFIESTNKAEAPGQMKHHYMPDVPLVILNEELTDQNQWIQQVQTQLLNMPDEVEHVKIFKPKGKIQKISELKLSNDAKIAARELYAQLRYVSNQKPDVIVFYKKEIHNSENWQAVIERLSKAASLILPIIS